MKLLILTSNALRHRFVANTVARHAEEALIIAECRSGDDAGTGQLPSRLQEHFRLRGETERQWFAGHETFQTATLPVVYGEVNSLWVGQAIGTFRPDACVVFGASIIREPLLSRLPKGRTVNLHLGLSPYYRGSGTNFWPFVNGELECVGATLLHLDAGIDTGPIIAHVRPGIQAGDTVHTAGCRVIAAGAEALVRVMQLIQEGRRVPRVLQWPAPDGRYYRDSDFTEEILNAYYRNLEGGLVARFLSRPEKRLRTIGLPREEWPAAGRRMEVRAP